MAFVRVSPGGTSARITNVRFHRGRIRKVLATDPHIGSETRRHAEDVIDRARKIYLSQEKGTTSLTDDRGISGPGELYENSFEVRAGKDNSAVALNRAKTASWVELGARAGGTTKVLRYRPLRMAVDEMAGEHGIFDKTTARPLGQIRWSSGSGLGEVRNILSDAIRAATQQM